jgi:hypothetical protein
VDLDFLELFLPEVLRYLDVDSLEFIEQESFSEITEGRKRSVDLLVSLATGDRAPAREPWETAKAMIEEMGYHRPDEEVAEIARQLGALSGKPDAN